MKFPNVTVKGVKEDLAKGEIVITLTVDSSFHDEGLELGKYVNPDAGTMSVDFFPRQMSFNTDQVSLRALGRAVHVKAHSRGKKIKKDPETGEVTDDEEIETEDEGDE